MPLSTATGETLERHVARSAALERHTQLADGLLPWMIALLVVSVAGYALHLRAGRGHVVRNTMIAGVAVLAIAAAAGTTVQVARIGHAGAQSAWDDTNMSSTSQPAS